MNEPLIQRIVIVGGGTAGWMAAAAFSKLLHGRYDICLIESDEISTVGVGEATIPALKHFNSSLGIDEDEFMRTTQGSFKLGIEFVDWGRRGHTYMHSFGPVGQDLGVVPFHHYWHRQFMAGKAADLGSYSIDTVAARSHKFQRPAQIANSPLSVIAYAFHFDAGLYAQFLRRFAEARGVRRTEGKVVNVEQHAADGHIAAVRMENGERIAGDLFIDCSGFRALLIEQTLATGFDDWSHWLPCDRAWAVPCERTPEFTPFTRSTAHAAGWQWRIPLQHRTGNGHVFSSRFMSEDEAADILMRGLDAPALAEPRLLKFVTGMRRRMWNRNVVAIGLAGGFMEPLESTSIYLIQTAIARLLQFFPDAGWCDADRDEYNRQARVEFELIRDFLVLHYQAGERDDSAFWRHCRNMPIPDALARKIALFRSRGRLFRTHEDLFAESSWLQVLVGQGVMPGGHHALAHLLDGEDLDFFVGKVHDSIRDTAAQMPTHAAYVARHCRASAPPAGTGPLPWAAR
jgi:tryptophan halogenase